MFLAAEQGAYYVRVDGDHLEVFPHQFVDYFKVVEYRLGDHQTVVVEEPARRPQQLVPLSP